MQSTIFYDETDFMRKLNHYARTERRLRPTTLFCTIQISNFHTLVSHKSMVEIVGYFLKDNLSTPKLKTISITTIQNLLQLYLYNNIFCYNGKIYTMTKGGPNTMPLTATVSSIYLFGWQKMILQEVQRNNGFFGR
jgi:hypothetical protein